MAGTEVSDQDDRPVGSALDIMAFADADDLATVRAFARSRAVALGLPPGRADLLVLAVAELATNAVQHTSTGGVVRLWTESGRLHCEVLDAGPRRTFAEMPPPEALRGRGLAIVRRVADEIEVSSGSRGTSTTVLMDL
jgi:serine/threonine-protein kinase RsbW